MRRDPMACALGSRDHLVTAKRKSLIEEQASLALHLKRIKRDIDKFEGNNALRAAKLISLYQDTAARLAMVSDLIASGKRFR